MGKLTKAQPVYRGISFRTLPRKLKRKKADNTRGGIEFGFLSATADAELAMTYAADAPSAATIAALLYTSVRVGNRLVNNVALKLRY